MQQIFCFVLLLLFFFFLYFEKGEDVLFLPIQHFILLLPDSDAESYDSYDENVIGIEECLFCSYISKSLEDNVKHMTSNHGFFLPDAEFIVDLEGLITYLGKNLSTRGVGTG